MCKDCSICLEPIFTNTDPRILRLKKKVLVKRGERIPVTKLKCGHTYHNNCIKNWFVNINVESSNKCPMCRNNIRFKPDSKDFMMNKLRYGDPDYRYGDENIFDVDTESSLDSEEFDIELFLNEEGSSDGDYDEYDNDIIIDDDPDMQEWYRHYREISSYVIDRIDQMSR